jgi:glutaredoxin 2
MSKTFNDFLFSDEVAMAFTAPPKDGDYDRHTQDAMKYTWEKQEEIVIELEKTAKNQSNVIDKVKGKLQKAEDLNRKMQKRVDDLLKGKA